MPSANQEELTEGLEHKKVVCELPSRNGSVPSAAALWYGLGKSLFALNWWIVPGPVYMVDYYAASYKCAHCEAQTGESLASGRLQAPVPVMKKAWRHPDGSLRDAGKVPEWECRCIARRPIGRARGRTAQHYGQLGDPQRPLVQASG